MLHNNKYSCCTYFHNFLRVLHFLILSIIFSCNISTIHACAQIKTQPWGLQYNEHDDLIVIDLLMFWTLLLDNDLIPWLCWFECTFDLSDIFICLYYPVLVSSTWTGVGGYYIIIIKKRKRDLYTHIISPSLVFSKPTINRVCIVRGY